MLQNVSHMFRNNIHVKEASTTRVNGPREEAEDVSTDAASIV